jgi:hypothetical protein
VLRGAAQYPRFLLGHQLRPIGVPDVLPEHIRQRLLGSLLGDGSIGLPHAKATNYRMVWTHGLPQREWVDHKAAEIACIHPTVTLAPNAGYGDTSVRMRTPCLPAVTELAGVAVRDGKKCVTVSWLDQIGDAGLAWWYCDDGHIGKRSANFHTEGYSREEVEIIRVWMVLQFGACSTVTTNRGHQYVRLPVSATVRLFRRIHQFIPRCMRYKLGDDCLDRTGSLL